MPIQSQELLSHAGEDAIKCALFAQVTSRYGQARLKAMGTSMLPSIWPGDTLLVERREIGSLVPGDVAVYMRHGRLFAHRVLRVTSEGALITQGDAMAHEDPPVIPRELLGCVSAIVPGPRPGRIRHTMAAWGRALAAFFKIHRDPLLQ